MRLLTYVSRFERRNPDGSAIEDLVEIVTDSRDHFNGQYHFEDGTLVNHEDTNWLEDLHLAKVALEQLDGGVRAYAKELILDTGEPDDPEVIQKCIKTALMNETLKD